MRHGALDLDRKVVNTLVVPDSSERWTTVIAVLGSLRPRLSARILRSFQRLILPRKMSATVAPSRCSAAATPATL